MRKYLLFISVGLLSLNNIKSQTIAAARSAAVGTTVTVRGIVTNGAELGTVRYMQDPTGGINAFGAGLNSVAVGDSIVVIGPTSLYNNLLQINPVNSFTVLASGKPLPPANIITPAAFAEPVESTLIRINNCTTTSTGTFAGNTNYTLTSASQTFVVRVDVSNTFIVGTPIPTGNFHIIGIGAQFCTSPTTGCTVGYQFHPRTLADIILAPTGINEIEKNSSFSIYPNPANEIIYIKTDLPVKSITINDVQGRTVYSDKENTSSVDIKGLSIGIYNITILTNNKIYHSKFSVQ